MIDLQGLIEYAQYRKSLGVGFSVSVDGASAVLELLRREAALQRIARRLRERGGE